MIETLVLRRNNLVLAYLVLNLSFNLVFNESEKDKHILW